MRTFRAASIHSRKRIRWYILLRLTSPRRNDPLRDALEAALADAFDDGIAADAVVTQNETQALDLWRIRESIPEAQKHEGGSVKNDVSLPLSRVPEFISRATAAVEAAMPGIRACAFGHIGDGNIHFNLSQPVAMDRATFMAAWEQLERIVSDIAADLDGSFSAEHGIGELKRASLLRYKPAVEIELMRQLKRAIDPAGIMNPGKILESRHPALLSLRAREKRAWQSRAQPRRPTLGLDRFAPIATTAKRDSLAKKRAPDGALSELRPPGRVAGG